MRRERSAGPIGGPREGSQNAGVLIETARLRMRPLGMTDLDDVVALHAWPEVSRFVPELPRGLAIERLTACEREWRERGHGLLAIRSRRTGEFLGRAGLKYWPRFDETELGWVLDPHAWGHGYATEAASACADWGFGHLDATYLTAMIRPDNTRSLRVAERLGMSPLREDVLLDVPVVVYSIAREGWQPRRSGSPAAVWRELAQGGARLVCRDFGGSGPPVLLLHGLAGHAGEWTDTARALCSRSRVLALDLRGHGRSERGPADVSRSAHIADVVAVVEQLDLAPVVLVGQSLGGQLALLVAARHPELVRGLVIAEASPTGGDRAAVRETVRDVGAWLTAWPLPFRDTAAAIEYFGGPTLKAQAWAAGLEERDSGLWPAFNVEVMKRTLEHAVSTPYWEDWGRIRCPTLIVSGGEGTLDLDIAREMRRRLPHAALVEIPGAGHDLHLERPEQWRDAVTRFLTQLDQTDARPPLR